MKASDETISPEARLTIRIYNVAKISSLRISTLSPIMEVAVNRSTGILAFETFVIDAMRLSASNALFS